MSGPVVPKVLLNDTWLGVPYAQGSVLVRRGTVIGVVPGGSTEAFYGGPSAFGPLPAGDAQDLDKSAITN